MGTWPSPAGPSGHRIQEGRVLKSRAQSIRNPRKETPEAPLFRSALRRTFEYAVVESGLTARRRRKDRERIAVLSYHNVVPSEVLPEGDLSLHLPLDKFQDQLDFLREHFDLLALEQIGLEGNRSEIGQPTNAVLPRLNVPRGVSLRGFDRRVSGFLS